ncbi:Arylsulfatase A [Lutibacter oricola]|uniref:Arylsulfatase A n=1 Tax=Lutibacter oricola TaxID=762486 RepID=A0A1H3BIY9_9FLAO|nr:sulfatase-like hydrolase/transferase [Lutibacter oricola]SDX41906.1 Arylsulfatase A [Lutibacter oricola]
MKLLRLIFCTFYLTVFSCSANTSTNKKTPPPTKPNILVILCDDLGYSDVGFNGSKDIPTPNLDKLAKNGTIFSSAYVTHPFCGPSRTSLMTGVYAHKIGAQFNLPPNSGETIKKGISTKETFISKVLNDAGYYTGIMGKWHLGSNEGYRPNERGFDEFYGFLGGGHNYFPEQYRAAYARQKKNGNKIIWDYLHPLEYNGKPVKETEYVTDALSREAVTFIDKASKKEDPFFLYLSYNAPHTPLEAKEEDLKLFQHIKDKKRRTYAAMVYAVDRGVKKVVESLKATNQFDNTLIVFFSDNGGKTKAGATNFPLREGKGSTCEGGFRVPMFFHWPNVVPAGAINNNPISALDFYPTFAHLAGAKIPEGKKLDGKNIWKNFIEGKNSYTNEPIFVLRHRLKFSDVGVRKNEFKALKIYNQTWKLYDVTKDKGEKIDLSKKYPNILKDLVQEAEKWSKTHQEPKWWHDKKTGIQWKEEKMPHFNETFKIK